MAKKAETKITPGRIALAVLLFPLLVVYGVVVLVRDLFRVAGRIQGAAAGLSPSLRCPNGHENAVTGRFECGTCRASYHGWVGRCGVCGAGAGWLPCEICGVGIPLPWERR